MAWTGNFKTQIDDLAGTLTASDDAAIQQWILDGCYDVMTKAIIKSGPEEVWKFVAKSGSQTSNAIDVDEVRTIAGVVRNNVFATKGMWGLKAKYADTNSIYAATNNSPVWYLDDSTLNIYPAPTIGEPANYYYVPEYAVTNWNTSTSSVNHYPSEYYYYVMLYAAIQVLHRKMLDSTTPTAVSSLSITAVAPDTPSLTAITYTVPSIALTAFDISGVAVPSATITAPNITAEGVSTLAKPDISGDVPYFSQDGTSNARIGFGTGTGQQFAALATKAITDLTITAVAPDTPVIDVVTYNPASTVTVASVDNMSVSDITNSGAVSVSSITAASSNQPNYAIPTVTGAASLAGDLESGASLGGTAGENDFGQWFSAVGQYIEDEEDVELANATMQKISTFISAYQADVQNALNEFNQEAQIYQQLVQQGTQNANATNQAALNDIQRLMQEHQADLQKNQSVAQANQQKDIQESQANAQNAQSKALQDAQQTVQAIIANNNALMQKYQAELSVYQGEVNTEVQEYTQNTQKEMQLWTGQQTQIMQQHSQTMQDALNVFNAQNVRYQANIQAEILRAQTLAQEYQKEADIAMQAKIQDYTFELQEWSQEVSRYQANVGTEVQNYQQKLARYNSEQQDANNTMQSIAQENQSLMGKYQAELSVYQAEVQAQVQEITQNLQKFQADLQAEGVDYQWLQDQYNRLKGEYERAFATQPQG